MRVLWDLMVVHNSTLEKMSMGDGALVIGVKLSDSKFVPHGLQIGAKEKADSLAYVPESLGQFQRRSGQSTRNSLRAMFCRRMCNCLLKL